MTGSALENAGWLALIAIVPLLVLMLTSFVKVSVVLSLLRNALGTGDAPSGLVVMGVSLVLTFFVMAPVAVEMVQAAATTPSAQSAPRPRPTTRPAPEPPAPAAKPPHTAPASPASAPVASGPRQAATAPASLDAEPLGPERELRGDAAEPASALPDAPREPLALEAALRQVVPAELHGGLDAVERGIEPLRRFLARHAGERDRATFVELAASMGHATEGGELWVLAPAFLTTELREAFAIAVLIFLPFLVIDLVVGLSLAALGLQMTSPQLVALPLKLLLFVAVDGWRLLIESLLRGYV